VEIIDSDSRTLGFSLRTAYYLAHCSLAAYGGGEDWPRVLSLGDSLRSFEVEDFYGFVAAQRDIAIVAFRGTESIGNALTDLETALIRQAIFPGLVHYGFSRAAEAVYPTVRALLTTLDRRLPIWVTGHSLGGAMASLVAHRLAHEGFPVRAIYSYGSPRPGDRHFRAAYRLPNYRFVNDNDLVPHLPLRWCYRHVGLLKLLTPDGGLLEEVQHWKAKKRALVKHAKHVQRAHRQNVAPPLKLGDFDWLADHHLAGYIAGIARLLPRVPRRRHPEYAGLELDAVPLHFLDEPVSQKVPRPKMIDPPPQPASPITQSDLAAVFLKQPRRKS
jgi:triacylglycerol lipase